LTYTFPAFATAT